MVRGLIGQAARAYFAPKGRAPLSAPSSGEQRGEPTSQHGAATCRKLWFKWQSVGERKLQKVSTANWLGYPERHQGPAKGRVKGTKCKLNLLFFAKWNTLVGSILRRRLTRFTWKSPLLRAIWKMHRFNRRTLKTHCHFDLLEYPRKHRFYSCPSLGTRCSVSSLHFSRKNLIKKEFVLTVKFELYHSVFRLFLRMCIHPCQTVK